VIPTVTFKSFLNIFREDGNDLDAIDKAITKAKSQNGPTMIEVKTIIGYGLNIFREGFI
jgi:transketolase